jgi:hypothetical protein
MPLPEEQALKLVVVSLGPYRASAECYKKWVVIKQDLLKIQLSLFWLARLNCLVNFYIFYIVTCIILGVTKCAILNIKRVITD